MEQDSSVIESESWDVVQSSFTKVLSSRKFVTSFLDKKLIKSNKIIKRNLKCSYPYIWLVGWKVFKGLSFPASDIWGNSPNILSFVTFFQQSSCYLWKLTVGKASQSFFRKLLLALSTCSFENFSTVELRQVTFDHHRIIFWKINFKYQCYYRELSSNYVIEQQTREATEKNGKFDSKQLETSETDWKPDLSITNYAN